MTEDIAEFCVFNMELKIGYYFSFEHCSTIFPFKMAALRNKRKSAAVARESQGEHSRNSQSRNTAVTRNNEDHITQVLEEIKGRVTEKLSQEFSRTDIRILGVLSKLDDFLLNPQVWAQSGTVPGTSGNSNTENQEAN